MSLINLPERFLYERLPQGVIELDERGLILAVVSGYQDRLEDVRSAAKKFELFFSPVGLPETGDNAVLVELQSEQGKVFFRSLDIGPSTPLPSAPSDKLKAWAASELNIEAVSIRSVRYGRDLLRLVDARVLDALATTIGAVLYKSAILEELPGTINSSGTFSATDVAQQKLVQTYFPRLKLKGTAYSFDALGRLLGFDDVRMTPLWSRLSPRIPNDPGNPANDPDFAPIPEYIPQQEINAFYNPHEMDDGPFYTWVGTASVGTSATNFYTQVVNGFQPFVKVSVTGTATGTAILHPASGSYVLAGGAPHTKAFVSAAPSPLRFEALGEGDSFNGLAVQVFTVENGTLRGIGISDRLSAIKYRSSFFDLGMTVEFEKAETAFGTQVARRNKDLANIPHTAVSFTGSVTAVSPYRPFKGGTAAYSGTTTDWITPFAGTVVSFVERSQAGVTDFQQNVEALELAGVQAAQAMEEVRPATRLPRRSTVGYLLKDDVAYAAYPGGSCLFSVPSGSVAKQFTGSVIGHPLEPYTTALIYQTQTTIETFAAESNDTDNLYYKVLVPTGGTVTGFVTFSGTGTNSYDLYAAGTFASQGTVCAEFTVTDSEVIRPEPYCAVSGTQVFAALGDYGSAGANQTDVSDMIHAWNAEVVVALGDNNYPDGTLATVVANNAVYADYNSRGRLLAALGNHDYAPNTSGTDPSPHLNYFNIPNDTSSGNKRYYNVRFGNVEFFCLNAGWNNDQAILAIGSANFATTQEPDGNSVDSKQARWLQAQLERSTARWKIVFVHFPPYSSATTTNNYYPGFPRLRWPFKQWGATAVLSAHTHAYERIDVDGFPYFNSGHGGDANRIFGGSIIPGSQVHYSASSTDYGALRIVATDSWFTVQAWTVGGVLIDTFTLTGEEDECRYQARPEDALDDDLDYETVDEYPWRRDMVGGGELIETDYYLPITSAAQVVQLSDTMSVQDQTGAEHNVYGIESAHPRVRLTTEERSLGAYQPGQKAIAFQGTFRDLSTLTDQHTQFYVNSADSTNNRMVKSRTDYDVLFEGAYKLYHTGLVNKVLVADPVKFNGRHHRQNLVGWLPFNEHSDANLAVADTGRGLTTQLLSGASPEDRVFDASRGWSLYMRPGAKVASAGYRDLTSAMTLSFWIYVDPNLASGGSARIVDYGPLALELSDTTTAITIYVRDANGALQNAGSLGLAAQMWDLIEVVWTPSSVRRGIGGLTFSSIPVTTAIGSREFNDGDTTLTVQAGARGFRVHDLRIWNTTKTPAELELVRYHAPEETLVQYRLGHILTLNRHDRYGLQVLTNGFCAPAPLPPWVRMPKYARVVRYDSLGRYEGESRFKETGLGGGQMPPYAYQLGNQFYSLTAAGTTVVSTQHGAMPGVNQFWSADTAPGIYMGFTGTSSTGSIATATASGSGAVPWPNFMEATNPNRDRVWVRGDDGYIYEIMLESSGAASARFVSQRAQPTGAVVEVATPGTILSVTTAGTVYQKSYAGTITRPPAYVYLNDQLVQDVTGAVALTRWQEPNSFGVASGVPALKEAGELTFINTGGLQPGNYKLSIDSGNIGQVDEEFDGFRVEVTVGDTILQRTLCPGKSGADFRQVDEFEFEIEDAVVGDWLLIVKWFNDFDDPSRGTTRQLAIYGYQLRRLATQLFRVSIAASGTTPDRTLMTTANFTGTGTTPGGWLARYNSYGTVVGWTHESVVYPGNDTLVSTVPLSDILTGRTADRREDLIVVATGSGTNSPFFVLSDPVDPTFTAFGTGFMVV